MFLTRATATRLVGVAAAAATLVVAMPGIAGAVPNKHRTAFPTFTAQPAAFTNQTTAAFAWTGPSGSTSYYSTQTCRLDGGTPVACGVISGGAYTISYPHLADGRHTLALKVKSGTLKAVTVTKTWTVDTAPPPPPVVFQPASPTSTTAVSISFTEADATAKLTCSLDGAAATPCTSPFAKSGLSDATHSLTVTATDLAGNASSTTVSWTIDAGAPPSLVVDGPDSPTNNNTAGATFTYAGTVDHFTCAVDSMAAVPCTSPWTPSAPLEDGSHTLIVAAYDASSTELAYGSATWVVDTTPPPAPFIIDQPASLTNQTAAQIDFTDDDATASFSCRVDSTNAADFAPCASPEVLAGPLSTGPHSVDIRATDPAGNTGATTTVAWTIDPSAFEPAVFFSGPSDPSNDTAPEITWDVSDTNTTILGYSCTLDGVAFAGCNATDPTVNDVVLDLTGKADGLQTFAVTALYPSAQMSAVSTYTWHLDRTAPVAPSVDPVASPARVGTVSFSDTSGDVARYTCALDAAAAVPCASPYAVNVGGTHVVTVFAIDRAGNQSSGTTSNSFVVKNSTPKPTIAASDPSVFHTHAVVFHVAVSEAGQTLSCAIDGGTATPCTAGTYSASVADGSHVVTVVATDSLGNTASTVRPFIVLTSSPGLPSSGTLLSPKASWTVVKAARAYGKSYLTQRDRGASLTIAFTGTSVEWFTVTGPDQGVAKVYVDGKSHGLVNSYARGRHYRVGHLIKGLKKGSHQLRIVVLGKKGSRKATDDRVSLDAVRYAGTLRSTPRVTATWSVVAVNGAAVPTTDLAGSALTATFTGTQVMWTDVTGPTAGRVTAYVDGVKRGVFSDQSVTVGTGSHVIGGLTARRHVITLVASPLAKHGAFVTIIAIQAS